MKKVSIHNGIGVYILQMNIASKSWITEKGVVLQELREAVLALYGKGKTAELGECKRISKQC